MTIPKLTYFDFPGRAEPIRLAFVIGGIAFEDERLTKEQFGAAKAAGTFALGSVPVLTVDGVQIPQSVAQLRYAAQLAGLIPSDPVQAARADAAAVTFEELLQACGPSGREQDQDKKKQLRLELADGLFTRVLTTLNTWAESGYLAGGQLSHADLSARQFVQALDTGFFDYFPEHFTDKFPNLQRVAANVNAHPKVLEWEAAKKK